MKFDQLTIKALTRAISELGPPSGLIGFKVNLADLRHLEEMVPASVSPLRLTVPSLGGLSLWPDVSIPRGIYEPVYRGKGSNARKEVNK